MLIPSIDLMGGKIVQLVQGRRKQLEFDDFGPWIERFRHYPLVQLIDLDAAMGSGDNRGIVTELLGHLPCQVGGGIRNIAGAERLLAQGARRVIFGSSLFTGSSVDLGFARSVAETLPRDALTFAVDAKHDRVAIRGWRDTVDLMPLEAIRRLDPYCGAFLYTNIESEGLMCGAPLEKAQSLRAITSRKLMFAGGIRSWDEINHLDALGIDAVVGMAIYSRVLAIE